MYNFHSNYNIARNEGRFYTEPITWLNVDFSFIDFYLWSKTHYKSEDLESSAIISLILKVFLAKRTVTCSL